MKIRIKVKSISKLKDLLTYEEYETAAETVGDLIREAILFNVSEYNKKRDRASLFLVPDKTAEALSKSGEISFGDKKNKASLFLMSDEAAEALSKSGKISFGDIENKRKVDTRVMQDEAVFGFQNGRFKIINETKRREYRDLSENLDLSENDALIFIKLTLLSGRRF